MNLDPKIRDRAYKYFLEEAPELLHSIEANLIALREDRGVVKVHEIMRATHTLKGTAANVGLETIGSIAHGFEGIVKCLYNPHLNIDAELHAMLLKGYECLRLPVTARVSGASIDEKESLSAAESIFARLQAKLGNYFTERNYIPTSAELGFDLVQGVFEVGIKKHLDEIANVLADVDEIELVPTLLGNLEMLVELAESFDLKGFAAIAQTAITALKVNSKQAIVIGRIMLEDLKAGQQQVLAGDRSLGGEPSLALQQLAVDDNTPGLNESLLETVWGEKGKPNVPAISKISSNKLDDSIYIDASFIEDDGEFRIDEDEAKTQFKIQPDSSFSSVRVKVEGLKRIDYTLGELSIDHNYKISQEEKLQQAIKNLLKAHKQHRQKISRLHDRIERFTFEPGNAREMATYTELLSFARQVREDTIQLETIAKSIENISQNSYQSLKKQHRSLENLRSEVMEARLLPLKEVFERFKNTVQQLGIMHDKPVELKLGGTDVLVDKTIAEKLYAPLLHLVQNAFDHGIESIEVRRQRGKPEMGSIEIRAEQQGGQTIIEVKDDGRGLDYERIRDRAVTLNLATFEEVRKLSAQQLAELIFKPGFSTAAKLSELSGRGIGLEAVKAQIEALKGTCSVYSDPDRGTTFRLQIPFTLMIVKLTIVEAGGIAYALWSDAIAKILPSNSSGIELVEGKKVLLWKSEGQESIVPVRKLSDSISYRSPIVEYLKDSQPKKSFVQSLASSYLLLLRQGNKFLGLEVDRILGEQETLIKPNGNGIVPPKYVYGCTVSDNSRLTLVIDAVLLIAQTQTPKVESTLPPLSAPALPVAPSDRHSLPPASSPTVLVVDDSLTQRQILTEILEGEGYNVLQAVHGLDAIEKMHLSTREIHSIVCDVEMPQLNGFEFLNYCRKQPEWKDLPIVILTSRSAEGNQKMALGLGADAYYTKPYVESDFLATIARLIKKKTSNSGNKFLPVS